MIPATPGSKIPENGPEPEFRPEFLRNSEPNSTGGQANSTLLIIGPSIIPPPIMST
jgi:hypothetical protein